MNYENNNSNDLVGPRSHEREVTEDELHAGDGQPLWMALLDDEETLVLTPDMVNDAKNKLAMLSSQHGEEVKMCMKKSTSECREILLPYRNAA